MGILFSTKPANEAVDVSLTGELALLPAIEQTHLLESKLLTAADTVRPEFAELLERYAVPVSGSDRPAEILAAMKDAWWGEHPGLQRATVLQYANRPPAERLELLDTLGYIRGVSAAPDVYDHALVMGGPLEWVRSRLENLKQEWTAGVEFNEIVMLGADRPLDLTGKEAHDHLSGAALDSTVLPIRSDWKLASDVAYADEMDMMRVVFEQAELPREWGREIPVRWIKSLKGDGPRFPNTEATVVDFLKDLNVAETGKILTASSQPFAHYQNLVTAAVFAEQGVEAADFVATGMAGDGRAVPVYYEAVYLDQLIRRFDYEVRHLKASQPSENVEKPFQFDLSTRFSARSA